MIDIERVIKVVDWLIFEKIVKSRKDLALKMGYTESSMSQILNQKVPLSERFIKKLSILDDRINIDWVMGGDGDMLQESLIKETQVFYGGEEFEEPTYVPLLPISAQGGSLNDFVVSVKDSDCERVISPIRGADFAMTVAGDSMAPEYPSGSQILIKKINERAFIDWGKVYVLDTCNGSVIKRIFPADDKDPGKVKCVSINPDYPPFEVSFEDIFSVYRVLLSMSIK
ncbi:LexA family transcriptional regulator [Bacteroides pyogenes]|uniref:LexA family transcriptional regulator n=1 Tax=Bacteroides pyogenes TaxID=310300 RepID=UPI001F30B411|nr:S24 family peptidase [Bacteroides pyogenes]MCF2709964.1 LexA family transcriptional regulator [Bacteroides pyogenes]